MRESLVLFCSSVLSLGTASLTAQTKVTLLFPQS